jgi:hypothetical protein
LISARARLKGATQVRTIYELLEAAARPVLEAVPERVAADDFYHPDFSDEEVRSLGPLSGDPADLSAEAERHMMLADMLANTPFGDLGELNEAGMKVFSLLLRGSVRAALSGVFALSPGTADIRCYSDGESAFLWSVRADGGVDFCLDEFPAFAAMILDCLPDVPEGVSETIRIVADGYGMVAEGQDDKVGAVQDFLARERTGTTLVDLVAFGGLCSEYPEHAMVVVDNDLGRHSVTVLGNGKSRRELVLMKSSRALMADWFGKSVEAGRTGF